MTLNNFFDEIYYINLDSRPDKKNFIENQLKKHNINATRFRGFTSDDFLDNPKYKNVDKKYYGRIGCVEAHRALWRDCLNRGVKSVFIIEDDAQFIENFNDVFNQKIKTLPNNWNFLPIGYNRGKSLIYERGLVKFKKINSDWESFNGISGSTAWGIKDTTMIELLKFTDMNLFENFDIFLTISGFFNLKKIKLYSTINPIINPIVIGDSDTNPWF